MKELQQETDDIKSEVRILTSSPSQKYVITRPYTFILSLVLVLSGLSVCQCTTLVIGSASDVVGVTSNYTFTLNSHKFPTTIRTQFSQWSPWKSQPYTTTYKYYLNSGSYSNTLLSCATRSSVIVCTMPTPVSSLGSTIQLIATNILNPSSTKPYPVTLYLANSDDTSETLTSNLVVTSVSSSPVGVGNCSSIVGVISTNCNWVMNFANYFDAGTILRIQYDNRRIGFDFARISGVVVTSLNASTAVGTVSVRITSWSDTASGAKILTPIVTTNSQASITASANLFLQHISSNITYRIQNFTAAFAFSPSAYTSVGYSPTSLFLGVSNQTLGVSAFVCPYTPKNNGTFSHSFTLITYSINDFVTSNCSNSAISGTSKSCRYNTTALPFSINTIKPAIERSTISAVITTYTYFAVLGSYFELCSQTLNFPMQPQSILATSLTFNTSKCVSTARAGDVNNNTQLGITVESAAVGDIVEVGLSGASMLTGWTKSTSGFNIYRYTLVASNIVNTTRLLIAFWHSNPTIVSASLLHNISLIRVSSTNVEYKFATNTSTFTFSLCPSTLPSAIQLTSVSLASSQTYNLSSLTIKFKNKFTDYSTTDYLRVAFTNFNGLIFLNTADVRAALNVTLLTNANLTNCAISVVNDTVLNIFNISRINEVSIVNEITIAGLPNPAAIYPVNNASAFQISITLLKLPSTQREQSSVTFSSATIARSNTYTTSMIPGVSISPLLPILTTTPISLTLTLTNVQKSKYFSSLQNSSLAVKLPFTCSGQTHPNGSLINSLIWVSVNTNLVINLNNCTVGYLINSTAVVDIKETISAIASTAGVYSLVLKCNQGCQTCNSDKYCTKCPNSTTGSTLNYLYSGSCFSSCPIRTYHTTGGFQCFDCHLSCQTCSGPSITQCLTCPTNYYQKQINTQIQVNGTLVNQSKNICISICGEGATYNTGSGKCQPCEIDCLYCINAQYCYFCKEGASLIGANACDFLSCTSPCKTCEGTMSNCTSCTNNMYIYKFECYNECPSSTYPTTNSTTQQLICLQITNPTLYFPITICSVVLIVLVCICNTCIDRGLTADTYRKNINMLTYSSAILAIMELSALFILLAFTYLPVTRGLAIAGLLIWVACNVIFAVYYFKVLRNDGVVMAIVDKMSSQSKCIYYTTVITSIVVALRLYRILYCGLFRGVAPYPIKKAEPKLLKKRKGSESKIISTINVNSIANNQKNQQQSPPPIAPAVQNNGKNTSMSNKTIKNTPVVPAQLSRRPSPKIQKIDEQQNTSQQSTQQHSKFELKRPYLIYITIGSMLASILFLAAAISQIIKQVYPSMLFSGLDLLFVVIASVIVTTFDMWSGVKKSYLMALDKGANNQTMENLRGQQDEATQQKILNNTKITQKLSKGNSPMKKKPQQKKQKKKYSPPPLIRKKSNSPPKEKPLSPHQKQLKQKSEKMKKLKNRYSDLYKRAKKPDDQISSEDNRDQLPDIKIFQDIEIFPNNEEPAKKIKKLKSEKDPKRMTSIQNMRHAENRSSLVKNSNTKAKMNWKIDDIFLGFENNSDQTEIENKTIKLRNQRQEKKREIYDLSGRKPEKQESLEDKESYINSLDRDLKQKKQDNEQDGENLEGDHSDLKQSEEHLNNDEQADQNKGDKSK